MTHNHALTVLLLMSFYCGLKNSQRIAERHYFWKQLPAMLSAPPACPQGPRQPGPFPHWPVSPHSTHPALSAPDTPVSFPFFWLAQLFCATGTLHLLF